MKNAIDWNSAIETLGGKEVKILKTDSKNIFTYKNVDYCVVGFVEGEGIYSWTKNGSSCLYGDYAIHRPTVKNKVIEAKVIHYVNLFSEANGVSAFAFSEEKKAIDQARGCANLIGTYPIEQIIKVPVSAPTKEKYPNRLRNGIKVRILTMDSDFVSAKDIEKPIVIEHENGAIDRCHKGGHLYSSGKSEFDLILD